MQKQVITNTLPNTMCSTVPFKKSIFRWPSYLTSLTSYLLLCPISYDKYGPLLKGKGHIQVTHSCYISKFAYWLQLSALASFEKPQPKLTINLSWRRKFGNKNLRELDVQAASKCCVSDHRP